MTQPPSPRPPRRPSRGSATSSPGSSARSARPSPTRVRPFGLTTLQYTTLSVLHRHGAPLSNAQLARRAYMTPQSMSEVIDALQTKGLIKRNPHPSHGRLLPATLTPKGRRVLAACDRAVDEMEDVMLADVGAREREAFLAPSSPPCATSAPGSRTSDSWRGRPSTLPA